MNIRLDEVGVDTVLVVVEVVPSTEDTLNIVLVVGCGGMLLQIRHKVFLRDVA